MSERTGVITFKGGGMTLVGDEVAVGQDAPNCTLTGGGLAEVELSSFKGSVVILSVVPSLDTPVCDTQTKRLNEDVAALGDGVKLVTVSLDLPFAQARWCGASDASNVTVLSDYKGRQFGEAWGLLIKELGLLTRAVYVVDAGGTVRYAQVVGEVTEEPDYAAALDAAKSLL